MLWGFPNVFRKFVVASCNEAEQGLPTLTLSCGVLEKWAWIRWLTLAFWHG